MIHQLSAANTGIVTELESVVPFRISVFYFLYLEMAPSHSLTLFELVYGQPVCNTAFVWVKLAISWQDVFEFKQLMLLMRCNLV